MSYTKIMAGFHGVISGTYSIAPGRRKYMSFKSAEIFYNLNYKSQKDFRNAQKRGDLPITSPSTPDRIYKDSGWISWGDFLGTGNIYKKDFLPYEEAEKLVHKLKLKNQHEYKAARNKSDLKNKIPAAPSQIYANSGWTSWGNYLGTGSVFKKIL